MRRVASIGFSLLICGFAAYGAAQLALGLGLGPNLATAVTIAMFISTVFFIDR